MSNECQSIGLRRAFATGAVVFRGPLEAIEAGFQALESVPGLQVVYVKTGVGPLRITSEEVTG